MLATLCQPRQHVDQHLPYVHVPGAMAWEDEKCTYHHAMIIPICLKSTVNISSHTYNYGLMDELQSRQVLSKEQVQVIQSNNSEEVRSRKLLEVMIAKRDYQQYEEFLVSLWTTNQANLARYIIHDGKGELQLQLVTELPIGRRVTVVTQLRDFVIVSHVGSNMLFVYNSKSFERLPDIALEKKWGEKLRIIDMVSCSKQRCLYVYDNNNLVILRVMDEGRGEVEDWLTVTGKHYKSTLSITLDGRLLPPRWKQEDEIRENRIKKFPPRLEVYSTDAILLNSIHIPSDLGDPRHAVETPLKDFAVLLWCDRSAYKVCILNKDGDVMRSWSGELELDKYFCHVAVDGEGRLFVAGGGLLLLLDSTLSTSSVLLREDKDSIVSPCRLHFSDEAGRLLVGNWSGNVSVFNVI